MGRSTATTLHLGLGAYEEDITADWKKYSEVYAKIGTDVSALGSPTGEQLVGTSFRALHEVLAKIDPDDKLGELTLDVPVNELEAGADELWHFAAAGSYSSWDYDVRYTVELG
jgi:hypothetical protein